MSEDTQGQLNLGKDFSQEQTPEILASPKDVEKVEVEIGSGQVLYYVTFAYGCIPSTFTETHELEFEAAYRTNEAQSLRERFFPKTRLVGVFTLASTEDDDGE